MLTMFRQLRDQALSVFGQMKPHQRITLAALGIIVLAPFLWLTMNRQESGFEPLQWGAAFDREVLMDAEQALMDRGFNKFKTVGQRILAPAADVEEYNGALAAAGIWSPHAKGELEKTLADISPFVPKDHFDALLRVSLQKEIRQILRNIDGIQDANVIWARSDNRGRGGPSVTASVHVTPRSGRELNSSMVEALRSSVAGMIPDLKRESVTVVDQSSGRSWTSGTPGDPFDNKLEEKKRSIIDDYTNRIRSSLEAMIPDVIVAVNVEFDNLLSSRERSQQIEKQTVELTNIEQKRTATSNDGPASGQPGIQANQPRDLNQPSRQTTSQETDSTTKSFAVPSMTVTEREFVASAPKSFKVSVSIPDEHFESLVIKDGVAPGTTDQEKANFKKAVSAKRNDVIAETQKFIATQIPTGSPPEAIAITSHRSIQHEPPAVSIPITNVLFDLLRKWGSSLALAGLGIWVLLMLKKSMPVSQAAESSDALSKLAEAIRPPEPVAAEKEDKPKSNRDYLRLSVEDDPAAAAAILAKWLQKT